MLLRLGRRAQRPGGLDIRRALDAFARGAAPEYDDVLRCVKIKFTAPSSSTSTPSTRRLLDGVAMSVPHRSTEPARPRRRREMT